MICFYLFKIASCNYADHNSMIYSSPDINAILTNLKHDCKNAIKWFGGNIMKANPDKFQFMVLSSDPLEQQRIEIENDFYLNPASNSLAS